MFQSLFDQRKVHIMVEMDKATLQNALDEVFPMIDDLELSVNRDVPLEEYRQVSNKLEGVRNLVTGLKPMIKPLPYSPNIVAYDDQTNKCNEGLESLLGPEKFQEIFNFERAARAKEQEARNQEEKQARDKEELEQIAACSNPKEKQNLLILWNKQNQKTEVVAKPNQSFMDFYSPSH